MDPDQISAISDRGWIVILILGLIAATVAFTTAWAILKSADKPAPTLLVIRGAPRRSVTCAEATGT